ncbi:hypothetical protein [Patulibacter sp. SYSU D01012]|uniref:hypothetical protein n=1 Tax=Patulibacter sp. SYSU D01012 TaxID=2817381 RepID=UPI001B3150A4|nr:hypothetical protein [Patulibacter sp. SYSU D01012]
MALGRYTATTNLTGVYRYVRSVTLVETSGTAAVRFQLRNGNDGTNDQVLLGIGAPAGGTATQSFAKPLRFPKGVRLEVVSGAGALAIDGY